MLFFPKFEFSNVFAIEMPEQMTLNTWGSCKILNSINSNMSLQNILPEKRLCTLGEGMKFLTSVNS